MLEDEINNIEWLFFDVGSTLVSEEKPFFHRLHEIAEVWDKSIVPDDQYLYKRPEYNCD
ncbi:MULTISPECIES: hypothetical protein [unclassified Butyrivibrio]|uniref:hypothetical protein n=1 Tax=unclassified Butyrivibrio TaxID=2639466 RepID=UPI0003B39E65|nr:MULTISPECIES: hypothetical protein [unclassified Butyrivibrio]MDC7292590.1 hypothetical protein [Butyrivibrio sp. DSM 10294]